MLQVAIPLLAAIASVPVAMAPAGVQDDAVEPVTFERLRRLVQGGEPERARDVLRAFVRSFEDAVTDVPEDDPELPRLANAAAGLGCLEESRALWTAILRRRERRFPPEHPHVVEAKQGLGGACYRLGDLADAGALFEEVLRVRSELSPGDPLLLQAKGNVAVVRKELGDARGALALQEEVLAGWLRLHPGDHPDVQTAKLGLANTKRVLGDLQGALELEEDVLSARERSLSPDHPAVISAAYHLAETRRLLGDLPGSLELAERVLAVRARRFPPDHGNVLQAKRSLALTLNAMGDQDAALALLEEILERRRRSLPPDHLIVAGAEEDLAVQRMDMGDAATARELLVGVVEKRSRVLSPDHSEVLGAKVNLAAALSAVGDLDAALALEEELHATVTRLYPPDHPDRLIVAQNLAQSRRRFGDLDGARELEEAVLAVREATLPAHHHDRLVAMESLALTRRLQGDLRGARELLAAVVDVLERTLPPDHPALARARQSLGATLMALDDVERARELFEQALSAFERRFPPDHPERLGALQNLAAVHRRADELREALALEQEVLAARERIFPAGHPDLLMAKQNLALTLKDLGDLQGALALEEEALGVYVEHGFPIDSFDRLKAVKNLAATRFVLGDIDGARELAADLLAGLLAKARTLQSDAPRSAREKARAALGHLFDALRFADGNRAQNAELFAVLETLRTASVSSSEVARAAARRPELVTLARRAASQRARLHELASVGPRDTGGLDTWRTAVVRAAEERDRAEAALRSELAEGGLFAERVTARAVATHLPPGSAAVSYLRYPRVEKDGDGVSRIVDSLLAFAVRADGSVERVELGPSIELEALVGDWRAALGRPLGARGVGVRPEPAPGRSAELGARLRERLLDPVLARVGSVDALHVVPDDFVHLVPLDALPLQSGVVGESLAVRFEVTLARLLRTQGEEELEGELSLVGGIEYDGGGRESGGVGEDRAPHPTQPLSFLPGTLSETERIAASYREVFGREPRLLTGADATKPALITAAPSSAYLHLATHGWFAGEGVPSQLDDLGGRPAVAPSSARATEDLLEGFAPETLCGLALAGANRGRASGVLTAEELAGLDLGKCELAVLSACETNVGIRRAGQGIQSLQGALHAAGARTAITSLWKVDDAATGTLMERFYACLWVEGMGKADALWEAKSSLRAEGRPLRDWAAWVLSGDPD